MNILIGSANRSILKRWSGLFDDSCRLSTAATPEEIIQRCTDKKYDLVLLHRQCIDQKRFQAIRDYSSQNRFFILSDQPNEEEGLSYLKLGIVGYGNTYISKSRLAEAIRVIMNNGVWLGQKIIQALIQESYVRFDKKTEESSEERLSGLTRAERKIADLVAKGWSNLEIAAELNVKERTVKAHLTSIYEKTKTGNRLNLALLINHLS